MPHSLQDLMQLAVAEPALAIHLHDGEPPVLELAETIARVEGPNLGAGETLVLLRSIAPREALVELERNRNVMFENRFNAQGAFRVMAFHEQDSVRVELRLEPNRGGAAGRQAERNRL